MADPETARGNVQFVEADRSETGGHGRTSFSRNNTLDSIRTVPRNRTVPPGTVLPIFYRTLSFNVEESKGTPRTESKKNTRKGEVDYADFDWHKVSPDELFQRLSTSGSDGLSSEQVLRRLKQYGQNRLTPPSSPWFRKSLGYIFGGFGTLLLTCSILVFISWKPLGSPPAFANLALAIAIACVWAIQAFFSWFQDWSSSHIMASIKEMLPNDSVVIRNGQQEHVSASDLVPGDVITIKAGNRLPADVRFFQLTPDAAFDRSILTGEVVPLRGSIDSTDDNYLETACIGLAGTHCTNGTGLGVILATGDRTVFGRLASLTNKPKNMLTNLEREIYHFVAIIAAIMIAVVTIVCTIWGAWLRKDHPEWISVPVLIVDCVSVAVAFVPEGLPIAVTASLTIIARVMKRNKILCKSLKTVETLGSVSTICSDKTGTLTKNQMTVTDCMVDGKPITAQAAAGLMHLDSEHRLSQPIDAFKQLAFVGALCNAGEFDPTTLDLPMESKKIIGDATDRAILRYTEGLQSVSGLRSLWDIIFRIPFNSKNKFMAHVVAPSSKNKPGNRQEKILTVKGAPDILLPRCMQILTADGTPVPLKNNHIRLIEEAKDHWSSQSKRVILLAQKDITESFPSIDPNTRDFEDYAKQQCTSGLVIVGLVAIVDPPRDEIPEVIRTLRTAGVKVFMVTGDFQLTAQAIATECGIITQPQERIDDVTALSQFYSPSESNEKITMKILVEHSSERALILSGTEVMSLTESQWDAVQRYEEVIFARTTPEHKLKIVKELQARGEVIGMTGDGVNDAPSLKAADIGIAMGSGSDIAIEAADMVLLDSFAAIVEAVKYGRVVFHNLRKTICYLLPAGSYSEFWPIMTNVALGLPQVLSSFLMIIICCCTDAAAATTLAYEKPEADVMRRKPRNPRKDHLVDWKLLLQAYGFIGTIESVLSFTMSYWYAQRKGLPFNALFLKFGAVPDGMSPETYTAILNRASSIYFVNLVVMQWFSLMAIRTRRLSILQHPPLFRKETKNLKLFLGIIFALLVSIFFLYVPRFYEVFGNTPVPVEHWFLPMAFGMGLLLLDEGRKWTVRNYPTSFLARIAW